MRSQETSAKIKEFIRSTLEVFRDSSSAKNFAIDLVGWKMGWGQQPEIPTDIIEANEARVKLVVGLRLALQSMLRGIPAENRNEEVMEAFRDVEDLLGSVLLSPLAESPDNSFLHLKEAVNA